MADCTVTMNLGHGADVITRSKVRVRRLDRGDNGEFVVAAGWSDVPTGRPFTTWTGEQGVVYQVDEKGGIPGGVLRTVELPDEPTAAYSELVDVVPLPAGPGVLGDEVIADALSTQGSASNTILVETIAADPTVIDAAAAAVQGAGLDTAAADLVTTDGTLTQAAVIAQSQVVFAELMTEYLDLDPTLLYPAVPLLARGDSTTAQTNVTTGSRAFQLLAESLGVSIVNRGDSGATSAEIAHLSGAKPATANVTGGQIPTTGYAVLTSLTPDVVAAGDIPTYAAEISGVIGTISASGSERRFTPTSHPASPVAVTVATITSRDALSSRRNVLMLGMGTNDIPDIQAGTRTVQDVCDNYRAVTNFVPGTLIKRALIWGPLDRGAGEGNGTARGTIIRAIEAWLAETYGTNFLPVRALLSSEGLARAGITPTTQDNADVAAGAIPQSLRDASSVHLNAAGMAVQAELFEEFFRAKAWFPMNVPPPVPTWSPLTYGADLYAWYDPSTGTDGATISALPDQGPNDHDGVTIVGTPVYDADGLGGTPSISFDGSSSIKSTPGPNLSGPFSIVINAQANTTGATQYVIDGNGLNSLSIYRSASSGYGARRAASTPPTGLPSGINDANPHSIVVVFTATGAASKIYVDGEELASNDQSANALTAYAVMLGAGGGGSNKLTGKIGDVVVLRRALDATEVADATYWLKYRRDGL